MEVLKNRSKLFWTLLIVTSIYFIAREGAQLAVHGGWLDTGLSEDLATTWIGGDLRINVNAAHRLIKREQIYYEGYPPKFEVYNYTPFYATFLSVIVSRLPFSVHAFLHGILSLTAYFGLFVTWFYFFPLFGLPKASENLILLLPVWFIYTAWWGDALLLNIYIVLALTASWLFYFIWRRHLWLSTLLLILILQVKPQWAFALVLPLVLGQFRFFIRLLALVLGGYLLISLGTILYLEMDYGMDQYISYYEMLATHHLEIPWHEPGEFIGYDHSLAQIYFYLFGYDSTMWSNVRLIKIIILSPLGIALAMLMWQIRERPNQTPLLALELFFALYLAAFIWLDLVWELTLSIIIFVYLMTILENYWAQVLITILFGWYAISDLWQLVGIPVSAAVLGKATVATYGPPVWADPSFHVPIIMFMILAFYTILVTRLFIQIKYRPVLPNTAVENLRRQI